MLLLTNAANSFTGPLTITAGTLSVATINNAQTPGSLGESASAVTLGTSGGSATFDYSGPGGGSTTRPFRSPGSTAVFQVDNAGANLTLNGR